MTTLAQLSSSQAQKEVTANQNFGAVSPAALFAKRDSATTGLTFGYYGGVVINDGAHVTVNDGTVACIANLTQCIEGFKVSATTQALGAAISGSVVTTAANHNLQVGDVVYFNSLSGMTQLNGSFAHVIAIGSATTFTMNVSTAGFTAHTGSTGTIQLCGERATTGTFTVGRTMSSSFTPGSWPMYQVVAGASTLTTTTDYRNLHTDFPGAITKASATTGYLTSTDVRNKVIEITGTLAANATMSWPAIAGFWGVKNSTSGAFTLTVRSPAGSGIVLPQGKMTLVVSDGSSFFDTLQWLSMLQLGGDLTLEDAKNIILNATTGTKIGTATSQKLGFWNVTPVIQPAAANQAVVTPGNTNGAIGGLTISAAYSQAEVQALRDACETLADDVRAAVTLINQLRADLVTVGLIKGSA